VAVNPEYLVAVFPGLREARRALYGGTILRTQVGAGSHPHLPRAAHGARADIARAGGIVGPETLQPIGMVVAVLIEALTGLLLGFAAQLIFWVVTYAGEVMGFQIGLSMAHVFNPIDGTQSNPIGNILSMTFLIVFLMLDGHHQVIRAVMASFEIVPLAGGRSPPEARCCSTS
jgi:hypothetical protein